MLLPSPAKTTRRIAPLFAVILLVAGLAPAAHALRIEFGADTQAMSNEYVSITREVRDQTVSVSIFGGGTTTLRSVHHTIDFRGGPVLLTDVERIGASDTDAGSRSNFVARLISRAQVQTIDLNGVRARVALEVDAPAATLDLPPPTPQVPSTPVPEPGAALLFASGLLTAGFVRRR